MWYILLACNILISHQIEFPLFAFGSKGWRILHKKKIWFKPKNLKSKWFHSITYVDLPLTSLPWFCKNSTSCWEKVVMEIDLTLWGGLSPLLKQKQTPSNETFNGFAFIFNRNRRNVWDKWCGMWHGCDNGMLQKTSCSNKLQNSEGRGLRIFHQYWWGNWFVSEVKCKLKGKSHHSFADMQKNTLILMPNLKSWRNDT